MWIAGGGGPGPVQANVSPRLGGACAPPAAAATPVALGLPVLRAHAGHEAFSARLPPPPRSRARLGWRIAPAVRSARSSEAWAGRGERLPSLRLELASCPPLAPPAARARPGAAAARRCASPDAGASPAASLQPSPEVRLAVPGQEVGARRPLRRAARRAAELPTAAWQTSRLPRSVLGQLRLGRADPRNQPRACGCPDASRSGGAEAGAPGRRAVGGSREGRGAAHVPYLARSPFAGAPPPARARSVHRGGFSEPAGRTSSGVPGELGTPRPPSAGARR